MNGGRYTTSAQRYLDGHCLLGGQDPNPPQTHSHSLYSISAPNRVRFGRRANRRRMMANGKVKLMIIIVPRASNRTGHSKVFMFPTNTNVGNRRCYQSIYSLQIRQININIVIRNLIQYKQLLIEFKQTFLNTIYKYLIAGKHLQPSSTFR